MYSYSNSQKSCESLNIIFNKVLGDELIYRVILPNDKLDSSFMILIFSNEGQAIRFSDSLISRYTCDTSGIYRIGLSIVVNDINTKNNIINKSLNLYNSHGFNNIST